MFSFGFSMFWRLGIAGTDPGNLAYVGLWVCGRYSFLPPGVSPAQRDALAQGVEGVLWFAGEHVCGDHPSTVHGAMLSGRRAAASARL
jgi:monoamine oxidase